MARSKTRIQRRTDYTHLTHAFAPQGVFSDEGVHALHDAALGVLEDMGLSILLPEAREILAATGARVEGDMVHIGRDIVAGRGLPTVWR